MLGALVDGWRLSMGTLTSVPVTPPSRIDGARGGIAMTVAPLAVLPLGIYVALIGLGADLVALPPLVAAVLAVGALAAGNRAMHLDGLADTADGLCAPYERDRRLQIMKRGDTGPAGAATLVIVLVLQAVALGAVLARPWGWLLAGVLLCCSRAALTLTCHRRVPGVGGTGLATAVAGTVPTVASFISWLVVAALAGGVGTLAGLAWWHGLVVAAFAIATVAVLVVRCARRLGGITGDVCGATIEVSLAAMLVVAAAG